MRRPVKLTIPLMIIALILTVYFVDQQETQSDNVIPLNTVDSVIQGDSLPLPDVALQRPTVRLTAEPKYIKKDKDGVEYLDYEKMYKTAWAMNDPERAAKTFPELAQGDVQKNKWIYIFQVFIFPKKGDGFIFPSENYDGVWRQWHDNGKLSNLSIYESGRKMGVSKIFYYDGTLLVMEYRTKKIPFTYIYSIPNKIDLRPQYAKEIAEFEKELAKFEKEHGLK